VYLLRGGGSLRARRLRRARAAAAVLRAAARRARGGRRARGLRARPRALADRTEGSSMSEVTLRERDGRARSAAKREFARPLVLAAGAGTGKTTTLVARVVAWCLQPGWERAETALRRESGDAPSADAVAARTVSRVVAITFTEAAAAEMAKRLGRSFAELAAGTLPEGFDERARRIEALPPEEALPADPALRAVRARALLGVLDQLPVRTIHAFCRRVLALHPLEAGIHPQFEIDSDGARVAEEVRAAVERRLSQAYDAAEPDPHWLYLAARSIGPAEIAAALEHLAGACVPASALAQPGFTPALLARVQGELESALRGFFEAGGSALLEVPKKEVSIRIVEGLAQVRERIEALRGAEALAAWADLPDGLARAGGDELAKVVAKWAEADLTKAGVKALGARRESVVAACATLAPLLAQAAGFDPVRFEHARAVLHPLLEDLEERLHARGILSFDALLRLTHRLLRERPEVAARLRRSIDQLLVDEFQDTDRVQCEILRILALEGPPGERPGLFLVGDPKQSIYGWRNADLAAYDAFVAQVVAGDAGGAPGEQLLLARNFRSAPSLLDAAQALLEPLFAEEPGVQPPFQRLVASEETQRMQPLADARIAPVERWLSCDVDREHPAPIATTSRRASEIEAEALARDLARLHAQHAIPWKDVAILLRALSDVDVYLEALRRAGIPYEVAKDRSYYRRREVIEAAALVRCVLDPNDRLALVTWLRSASVGVPDAAWVPLFAQGLPERVAALAEPDAATQDALAAELREVARGLDGSVPGLERIAGWERSAAAALAALATLRASHEREPADVFVERLRRLSALELTESARPLGFYRAANLDRFFAELTDELAQQSDPSGLLRRLRSDVAEGREAAAGAPRESAADAVQVLSIHAAKGLDFAIVYCPQLHKAEMGAREDAHATEIASAGDGFVLRLFGVAGPGWSEQRERRALRAEAERVRLLYVALTRAKRRLVLAGRPCGLGSKERDASPLALLAEHDAEIRADRARATALLDRGVRHEDAAGVRCLLAVVLADEPRDEAARAEPASASRRPDAKAVATESRRLAAARAAAAAHAVRPRTAPASREGHEAARERIDASTDELAPRERAELSPADGGLRARARGPRADHAPRGVGDEDRGRAKLRGTVVHRALELMDFAADPAAELTRLAPSLRATAALEGDAGDADGCALDEATELLRAFAAGGLFPRVRALAGRVVARELPIWVDAALVPSAAGSAPPVDAFAGTIDLLYREADGRYVVADWKTDAALDEDALRARAARYAMQGRVYVRAVQAALGLDHAPRFELWFLRAGQVWDASDPEPRRLD